ncbi:MAG: hypothetical protein WCR71_01500 [Bacteroidales bacterium]
MKLRQLITAIAIIAVVASCTSKKDLSNKLVGKWSGNDSIELTMIDSAGNTVIQEFIAPIEIEYLADSTFTAVITVTENKIVKIGGVATFADSTAMLTGSLSCQIMLNLTGQMSLNEDEILSFKYRAENSSEGLFHNGVAVATRVKK